MIEKDSLKKPIKAGSGLRKSSKQGSFKIKKKAPSIGKQNLEPNNLETEAYGPKTQE